MIYIYNCYGGTHTSSLASAIHLNKLPRDRVPTADEILGTDYFNELGYDDMGKIIYRGSDEDGNKVFTLGRGMSKVLIPCLENLLAVINNEYGLKDKVVFSNMTPTVPPIMTIGGFFSKALRLNLLGEPLLVVGAKKAYPRIVDIVNYTRNTASNSSKPVIVLSNKSRRL